MVTIGFVIVGAFLAVLRNGDFSLRIPKRRRLPNAVFGEFLMGAGSRLALGVTSGIYTVSAELSIHSFIATVGIIADDYTINSVDCIG